MQVYLSDCGLPPCIGLLVADEVSIIDWRSIFPEKWQSADLYFDMCDSTSCSSLSMY